MMLAGEIIEKPLRIGRGGGNVAKARKNRNYILTSTGRFRTTYDRPDRS
jgi:hypothetical protein